MKYFKNYSKEQFINSWDSVPYSFSPGQGMFLEDYLAEHHAKHLANREMIKDGLQVDDPRRSEYLSKCLLSAEPKDELKEMPESVQIMNMNKEDETESTGDELVEKSETVTRRGRPKKKKEESKEEIVEEEFSELPNN